MNMKNMLIIKLSSIKLVFLGYCNMMKLNWMDASACWKRYLDIYIFLKNLIYLISLSTDIK